MSRETKTVDWCLKRIHDQEGIIVRLRAELAEKDVDTRDMDEYDTRWFALHDEIDEAKGAIARVRELCAHGALCNIDEERVLAALDGDDQ